MKNRIPYSVPDGYFASLEEKLLCIPEGKSKGPHANLPYYAFSMVCVAAVALLLVFLWKDKGNMHYDLEYEQIIMSDLIPHTDPYFLYSMSDENPYEMTEQDIEDYLINCAVNINEE